MPSGCVVGLGGHEDRGCRSVRLRRRLRCGQWLAIGVFFLFLVPVVATANCLLSLVVARFHLAAGLMTAALLALLMVLLLTVTHALGVAPIGPSLGPSPGSACHSGVPPWWPWWLPHQILARVLSPR